MSIHYKLFLFLFFIVAKSAFSQELMTYKNSKPFPATTSWEFMCENYALSGTTNVQIAKTEKGGILKIAMQTTDPSFYIAGTVYLYLADNSIIYCADKGIRENKDDQIMGYFTFSEIEMNKLKKTPIQSIRFNINGKQKKFSSQIGNFTATNKKVYFKVDTSKPFESYNTAQEIDALYK
jgi:hypothetical protein